MKRFLSVFAALPMLLLFSSAAGAASTAVPSMLHGPIEIWGVQHNNVQSSNWSGYSVESPSQFTEVTGTWVQPPATCPFLGGSTYSSFWVGLDGYTSSSVEQLGTDSDCGGFFGTPSYYAWYEMYPANSVSLSTSQYPVNPGDTLTASVTRSGTSYAMTMKSSEGWTFTTTQTGSDANSSAEWIAEAPNTCFLIFCSNASLTNYGSVTFSGAEAATGASLAPVSSFTTNSGPHDITMTNGSGVTRAQPGALTANGEGFTDTWAHN